MGRLPALDDLLLQHQKLAQGGAATKPAANPELDAIKKNAGIPAAAQPGGSQVQTDDDGNHMITTPDGKSIVVGPDGKPLPNGGKVDPAAPATAAAAVQAAGKDPMQVQKGPAPAPGTTTTQSNQSVRGTMTMGKPDGPITFNGKVVQPGAPEYAAASQALIQSQQKVQNFKSRNDQNVEKNLATSGAPVTGGAGSAGKDRTW